MQHLTTQFSKDQFQSEYLRSQAEQTQSRPEFVSFQAQGAGQLFQQLSSPEHAEVIRQTSKLSFAPSEMVSSNSNPLLLRQGKNLSKPIICLIFLEDIREMVQSSPSGEESFSSYSNSERLSHLSSHRPTQEQIRTFRNR